MSKLVEFNELYLSALNKHLIAYLRANNDNSDMNKLVSYSLENGGKRIRPLLFLMVLSSYNSDINDNALKVASAIEYLHTYSLIHDDLPDFDNDDFRRGKYSSHKVFGNAQAILAGDGLLTFAFYTLADTKYDSKIIVKLVKELAEATGTNGMVFGQYLDISSNDQSYSLTELKLLHRNKTGKLIEAATEMAAIVANVSVEERNVLKDFAVHLGIAFQIRDDIIDVTENEKSLGKTAGKDALLNKSTYVTQLGLKPSIDKFKDEQQKMKKTLKRSKYDLSLLSELVDSLSLRED